MFQPEKRKKFLKNPPLFDPLNVCHPQYFIFNDAKIPWLILRAGKTDLAMYLMVSVNVTQKYTRDSHLDKILMNQSSFFKLRCKRFYYLFIISGSQLFIHSQSLSACHPKPLWGSWCMHSLLVVCQSKVSSAFWSNGLTCGQTFCSLAAYRGQL